MRPFTPTLALDLLQASRAAGISSAHASVAARVDQRFVASTHAFADDTPEALKFPAGALIRVIKEGAPGEWWWGQFEGEEGWYPSSFTTEDGTLVGEMLDAVSASGSTTEALDLEA